jgi:hypothetical protein
VSVQRVKGTKDGEHSELYFQALFPTQVIYAPQTKILEGRTNFIPPNRRFWKAGRTLSLQNEDFGRSEKHFRVRFRSNFQRCVAQIVYSHPLKVLRKRTLKCFSDLPKSSFGEHIIAFVVIVTNVSARTLFLNTFKGVTPSHRVRTLFEVLRKSVLSGWFNLQSSLGGA